MIVSRWSFVYDSLELVFNRIHNLGPIQEFASIHDYWMKYEIKFSTTEYLYTIVVELRDDKIQ